RRSTTTSRAAARASRSSTCSTTAPSGTSTPSTRPATSSPATRRCRPTSTSTTSSAAFQLGVDISGTGVRNDFATPDNDKRAADVKHVKEWIEVAARLGAPVLRVFAGPEPKERKWDEVAEWLVEDLNKCVEHAEKYGVLIGIQNHWDFLKTSEQV